MATEVRPGARDDLAACKRIYDHYVHTSHATFDIDAPDDHWWTTWFQTEVESGRQLFLVAERDSVVAGYAKTDPFRPKAAYDTSRYATVYCAEEHLGAGLGQVLYERLFDVLPAMRLHRVYAAIALPNEASVALHERFGFERVGLFREVGYKYDRFWDVATYERAL